MNIRRLSAALGILIVAAMLLAVSALAYAAGEREGRAAPPTPQMAGPNMPAPLPRYVAGDRSQTGPAALASTLSYYFIGGNTFTPYGGSTTYFRQVIGCVNQMPQGHPFSAPVHLPQGSQVVSITLYTYDTVVTTTISTAYFILNDGKGNGGYTMSADSPPNVSGYRQNTSTQNNAVTVDNQNHNYLVEWRKQYGTPDSLYLSLCGVRVAYYAPLGAMYLPVVTK
jgi:hypothetical protein